MATPSVISTCVLMHITHMLVGFGGMGKEQMQHRMVGIVFSDSAGCRGRPSVGAASMVPTVRCFYNGGLRRHSSWPLAEDSTAEHDDDVWRAQKRVVTT